MKHAALDRLHEDLQAFTLPGSSRIWLYVASRELTHEEAAFVSGQLHQFTSSWMAHGSTLNAQGALLLRQIVVLALDETNQQASGCSIDASVAVIRSFSDGCPSLSDVDLLDRSQVIYLSGPDDELWQRAKLHDFWAMRKAGNLTDAAIIFDSTVTQLGALRSDGTKALSDSWHAHMW